MTEPVLSARGLEVRFAAAGQGLARPLLQVRNRLTVERKSLDLFRREEEQAIQADLAAADHLAALLADERADE